MRRLLIIAVLALLAVEAQAATRLHFGGGGALSQSEFFITPAADSGWETTADLKRGEMHVGTPLRARSQAYGEGFIDLTPSSADQAINMQYQLLMPAGVTFTSGSTTVKMQGTTREAGSLHDVNQCIIGIRIIDDDGTTVNATLLAVANYGATLEFIAGGGTNRNHTCADGDTVTSTYTTVAGDWLVVETGFQNDGTTGTPSQAASFYTDGSGFTDNGDTPDVLTSGDCPVDNTSGNCTAWIEFSNTWTTPADTGPVTRLWLPASTAADVTPTPDALWDGQNEEVYRKLASIKGTSSLAAGTLTTANATDFYIELDRVYVSNPMAAGVVFTKGQTTVSGQLMWKYAATSDDVRSGVFAARIVSWDGTTERIKLFRPTTIGQTEFTTTFTNYSMVRGTAVVNSYTTIAGDRLVCELGYGGDDDYSAATTPQAQAQYGEDATDCTFPAFTGTTSCAGWVEFSNKILFADETVRPPWWGRLLMADPGAAVRSLAYRWLDGRWR